jgi:Flp pilus assembly protein TadG
MIGRRMTSRTRRNGSGRRRGIWTLYRDPRGIAAVEFGMTFPVLLLFVVGLIELSRILWTDSALQLAVDEAGRYALTNPSATSEQIANYASTQLVSVDASQVTVTVMFETSGGVNFVTITATIPYASMTQLLPLGTFNLTGQSRVPLII